MADYFGGSGDAPAPTNGASAPAETTGNDQAAAAALDDVDMIE